MSIFTDCLFFFQIWQIFEQDIFDIFFAIIGWDQEIHKAVILLQTDLKMMVKISQEDLFQKIIVQE